MELKKANVGKISIDLGSQSVGDSGVCEQKLRKKILLKKYTNDLIKIKYLFVDKRKH